MNDPFRLLGTAIENRYRIDAVIGEGGFGVVYRGHHMKLEHPVAVKCLKIPSHFTPEAKEVFLKRFREEGKILLKLADAAGVPRIYDYGTHIGEREIPYLVIEWLDGRTLEDMLKSRRSSKLKGLRGADAIALMLPAVEALAIAHRSQIAHRDIKPANLFISVGERGPVVKVLDFGIAKAMQEGETQSQSQTQTSTSFRAFTPNYAAPEQFAPKRHGASGPWTDVHALGLLLFELLTDQVANSGDEFVECLESAMSEQRPSPKGRGAQISDELEAVVAKAVARSPDARYRDAGALAAALRDVPEAKQGPSSEFKTLVPAPKTVPQPPLPEATASTIAPTPAQLGGAVPRTPRTELAPDLFSQLSGERAPESRPSVCLSVATSSPKRPTGTQLAGDLDVSRAVTHERVSQGQIPRAPTSRREKRSMMPLVLGSVLVVGGGLGALLWASSDDDGDKKEDGELLTRPSGSSSAPIGKDKAPTIKWARDVTEDAREIFAILEISESEAKGKFHSRVTIENGKITKAERVDPAGTIQRTTTAKYASDGSWERTTVDGRGNLIDTHRNTKDGVRTQVSRSGSPFNEGCARYAYKFSPAGDALERTCQDAEGHVIINAGGCQILAWEMSENHQPTAQRCLLEGGKPSVDWSGVHLYRVSYDAQGHMTEWSLFGVDGSAISSSDGCARRRFDYDAAGNKTSDRCIGSTGLPAAFRGGTHGATRHTYDEHGCEVRTEYVDVDDRPTTLGAVAAVVYTRDAYCGVLSLENLDAKGALVVQPGQPARREFVIDEKGNVTQKSCFDAKRLPLDCAGGDKPTVRRSTYDDQGREISSKTFDSAGNPMADANYPHETRMEYDARGLVIEYRYLDAQGKPAAALGNVARKALRYDALGSQISSRSYGVDDAPVVPSTGVHEIRSAYDDKHRLARIELRENDGSYAAKPQINISAIPWPDKAVRMEVIREEARLLNRYFDKGDKEVSTTDCTALQKPCYR